MQSIEVLIQTESGLHARPASDFVNKSKKYSSKIDVIKDGNTYNAKSIISILSMGAVKGTKLEIRAEGEDEREAVEALKILLDNSLVE